jgi:uncharacterized OB-fold protein
MSEWPIPKPIDPINAEFWQVCQDGVLRFQRCTACDRFRHLPRYMCASCGSTDYEWSAVEPHGSLYSWTVTHQVFHTKFEVPFIAAVVEFSEGVRLMSQLVDAQADQLALGLPVDVQFHVVSDEFQTPVFKLAAL